MDAESIQSYEEILKMVECNTCGEYCSTLRLCQFGHAVCPLCIGKCYCRTCCGVYTSLRVLVIDDIRSMLTFPCRFRNEGCYFRGKMRNLREHYTDCEYRSTFCPKILCGWKGKSEEFFEHFEKDHKDDDEVGIKGNVIKISEGKERRFIIRDSGVIFTVVFAFFNPNYISCYTVNFDYSYKSIKNFEIRVMCTLMNGKLFYKRMTCHSITRYFWSDDETKSLIDEDKFIRFRIIQKLPSGELESSVPHMF